MVDSVLSLVTVGPWVLAALVVFRCGLWGYRLRRNYRRGLL